jgi:hypothetical protein
LYECANEGLIFARVKKSAEELNHLTEKKGDNESRDALFFGILERAKAQRLDRVTGKGKIRREYRFELRISYTQKYGTEVPSVSREMFRGPSFASGR